jgi:hypothetical protein
MCLRYLENQNVPIEHMGISLCNRLIVFFRELCRSGILGEQGGKFPPERPIGKSAGAIQTTPIKRGL